MYRLALVAALPKHLGLSDRIMVLRSPYLGDRAGIDENDRRVVVLIVRAYDERAGHQLDRDAA